MKIIFSRKGFDSSYGRVPSPVFPDGRLLSLPIPSPAGIPAGECLFREECLGDIIKSLTKGRLDGSTYIHLDPDLDAGTLGREPGWEPAFGQVGAAQTHLRNQGVGIGDLFLFFGWFRPVHSHGGQWAFAPGSKSFHALFGWMQVTNVVEVGSTECGRIPAWLRQHPHIAFADQFIGQGNTIYTGAGNLDLGCSSPIPGSGAFSRWSSAATLTASGCPRSIWSIPAWLQATPGRTPMTYHGDPKRWNRRGSELLLRSVAKGQEFVIDADQYPEARGWARQMIEDHA